MLILHIAQHNLRSAASDSQGCAESRVLKCHHSTASVCVQAVQSKLASEKGPKSVKTKVLIQIDFVDPDAQGFKVALFLQTADVCLRHFAWQDRWCFARAESCAGALCQVHDSA